MTNYDLGTAAPSASFNRSTGFLIGADSQTADGLKIYQASAVFDGLVVPDTLTSSISSAGVSPVNANEDNVIAAYTIPAGTFDADGAGLSFDVAGSFSWFSWQNSKRVKLYFGCTAASVGSAVSGGTVIADTGVVFAGNTGWSMRVDAVKYGAAGSNTQMSFHRHTAANDTVPPLTLPKLLTATESGGIIVAVTGNAQTTQADIVFNMLRISRL